MEQPVGQATALGRERTAEERGDANDAEDHADKGDARDARLGQALVRRGGGAEALWRAGKVSAMGDAMAAMEVSEVLREKRKTNGVGVNGVGGHTV